MNFHEHDDTSIQQHDIEAQEQALAALLERVMHVPLAPLRRTVDELRERLDAVEHANMKTLRSTELVLADEIKAGTRKISGRLGDINNVVLALQDELYELAGALKHHDTRSSERGERAYVALARSHDLLAALDVRSGNSVEATALRLERLGSEVAALREQEQAGTGRLERQQTELGKCIDAVLPALDPRFAGLSATIDASAHELAQRSATLGEAQQVAMIRSVKEQLALQIAPLQARSNWLFVLCCLSLATTVGLFALLLMR
jgi:hypothetical protein